MTDTNGLERKLSESRVTSSTSTQIQKRHVKHTKIQKRHQRDEKDIAAVTRDLERLGPRVIKDCLRICKARGVLLRAAVGSGRTKTVVIARDDIVAYLSKRFGYSSSEIGAILRLDHSTILCSLARTKERQKAKGRK
jgi:hypothetical protein